MGLAASATAACGARKAPLSPYQYPIAPPPPDHASQGLDAVIDISRSVTVSDFRRVRHSSILAVIHKASEGGDYADTACAARRPQAEAAGLLWGTYHFGTGRSSGAQQAAFFLAASWPVSLPETTSGNIHGELPRGLVCRNLTKSLDGPTGRRILAEC